MVEELVFKFLVSTIQQAPTVQYGPYILFAMGLSATIAGFSLKALFARLAKLADGQVLLGTRLTIVETKQNIVATKVGVPDQALYDAEQQKEK